MAYHSLHNLVYTVEVHICVGMLLWRYVNECIELEKQIALTCMLFSSAIVAWFPLLDGPADWDA